MSTGDDGNCCLVRCMSICTAPACNRSSVLVIVIVPDRCDKKQSTAREFQSCPLSRIQTAASLHTSKWTHHTFAICVFDFSSRSFFRTAKGVFVRFRWTQAPVLKHTFAPGRSLRPSFPARSVFFQKKLRLAPLPPFEHGFRGIELGVRATSFARAAGADPFFFLLSVFFFKFSPPGEASVRLPQSHTMRRCRRIGFCGVKDI